MSDLAWSERGHGNCLATRGRHAEQRPSLPRREQNHTIVPPRPAHARGDLRQRLQPPVIDIDPLQLAAREETDGAAVRGPEGHARSFRAAQRLRGVAIKRADIEEGLPVAERDEDKAPAVPRDGKARQLGRLGGGDLDKRLGRSCRP